MNARTGFLYIGPGSQDRFRFRGREMIQYSKRVLAAQGRGKIIGKEGET